MLLSEKFKEDCERLIYVDGCGRIVEESILRKFYPDRQDWDKLLSVIEDNIISEAGHQERITWHQVWKEFAC